MTILRLAAGIALIAGWMVFAVSPKTPASTGPRDIDHSELHPKELSGTALSMSEAFAKPTRLLRLGGRLIVIDRYADQPIHILNAASGTREQGIGRRGEGPGEFKGARSVLPDPLDPRAFWVFDSRLARLTRVDPDRSDMRPSSAVKTVPVLMESTATDVAWLPTGSLIATGFFAEGRLAILDGHGRTMGRIGLLPSGGQDAPTPVLQHAYTGRIAVHPHGSLVALACRHASRLEIHATDGSMFLLVETPFKFDPVFRVRASGHGPVMATGQDLRFGYLDVATTESRIYALFSGRTRGGFPGRANYGEYVHVFDWAGNFLHAFRLDNDVIAIAVNEDSSVLDAVRHLPVPSVIRYRLEGEMAVH